MEGKLIRYIVAAGAGFVTYALGGWDTLLLVILLLVGLDVLTGITASIKEKKRISSVVASMGLWRKLGYILAIGLGVTVDLLLVHEGYTDGPLVRTAVLYGILIPELISVMENLGRLEVPLPGILQKIIALFKDKENVDMLPK